MREQPYQRATPPVNSASTTTSRPGQTRTGSHLVRSQEHVPRAASRTETPRESNPANRFAGGFSPSESGATSLPAQSRTGQPSFGNSAADPLPGRLRAREGNRTPIAEASALQAPEHTTCSTLTLYNMFPCAPRFDCPDGRMRLNTVHRRDLPIAQRRHAAGHYVDPQRVERRLHPFIRRAPEYRPAKVRTGNRERPDDLSPMK